MAAKPEILFSLFAKRADGKNTFCSHSLRIIVQGYFRTRSSLAGVLLLIDASIPPMEKDKEYADWLIEHNVPFTIVFTKCDRNKPGMPSVQENQEELERQLMVRKEARARLSFLSHVCFSMRVATPTHETDFERPRETNILLLRRINGIDFHL